MPSMRLSTRSRRFENTTVPPLTITCSIANGSLPPTALAGAVSRTRSRCSGRFSTGRTITSSVISGLPDQMLDSVTSASMLAAVRRLLMSRSLGSLSVTSFIVTFSDGHSAILAAAVDGELVAGLALDPFLDRRSQEAGRDADEQKQHRDHDDGGDGSACDSQYSHVDIPDLQPSLSPETGGGLTVQRSSQK